MSNILRRIMIKQRTNKQVEIQKFGGGKKKNLQANLFA